jgi:hypothetical protein
MSALRDPSRSRLIAEKGRCPTCLAPATEARTGVYKCTTPNDVCPVGQFVDPTEEH